MAACDDDGTFPTLIITNEELQRRTEQLTSGDYVPDKGSDQAQKSTPGLLYLSPTTVVNTNDNDEERGKTKRTKRRTRQEETRGPPELSANSMKQEKRRNHGTGATKGTEVTDQRPLVESIKRKGTSHSASEQSLCGERQGGRDGQISGDEEGLRAEWGRHENRKIERGLARWSGDVSKLDPLIQACWKMQECAENILVRDMELFSKLEITTKLWRIGHYPIVEALRGRISSDANVRESLSRFLGTSADFYSRLLASVESQLSFKTSDLVYDRVQFSSKTQRRKVMMAVVNIHNWYIYLGDLSRYQQQCQNDPDWSKPRRYYLRAQQLVPKNAKPYNQLAVLAISTHRRLDAVYYYMRSLSTQRPFKSAYDSLVGIFADSSRKAQRLEEDEKMKKERKAKVAARREKKAERLKNRRPQGNIREGRRGGGLKGGTLVREFSSGKKETWIMPGARHREGFKEEAKSHDTTHDTSHDVEYIGELLLENSSSSPTTLASTCMSIVRKVTSAFVLVHGKLFTKTGVETLSDAVKKTLVYFDSLLKGELRLEYAQLFLKMMVINIYSIHHAAETHVDELAALRHYCGVGLGLTLQVATVLLSACVDRMQVVDMPIFSLQEVSKGACQPSDEDSTSRLMVDGRGVVLSSDGVLLLDYLSVLLPAARILFDWFLCQKDLYHKSLQAIKQAVLVDFWSTTVTFLNLSRELFSGCSQQATPPQKTTPPQQVTPPSPSLWEDRALAGFVHIKAHLSNKDTFTMADVKKMTRKEHREQTLARLSLLSELCCLQCELQAGEDTSILGLTFNTTSGQFTLNTSSPEGEGEGRGEEDGEGGVAEELDTSFETEKSLSFGFSDSDDDVIEELSADDEDEELGESGRGQEGQLHEPVSEQSQNGLSAETEEDSEFEQLKAQRDGLVRQIEGRTLARNVAKNLLSEVANKVSKEMLITPKYLVPDTNCFVDMLPSIKTIVARAEFMVALPLTVVTELEGLSKGTDGGEGKQGLTKNTKVTTGAKNALEYIKTMFQAKSPYLKLLTAQGNLLSTLSFRDQMTAKASNDNLILGSCLQLHLRTQPTQQPGENSCYKVVLLTEDRNLRVKAHANDQPVKDIPNFMKLLTKQ